MDAELARTWLPTALSIAGGLHFGILIASALTPKVLDWRRELNRLAPLSRDLVWVHGAFIVLTIVGFGAVTLAAADELASGTLLARCLAGFIAVFWFARLGVQFFVFDARPFLTRAYLRIGYHALTLVFCYLAIVYAWAAIHEGARSTPG
jgi:hypothetical protein